MNDMILLKQGEIVLKGQNRRFFEGRLLANLKHRLRPFGEFKVYSTQSTVYAEPLGSCDMDGAFEAAQMVFGFVGVSRALACDKDKDAIFEAAKKYLDEDMRAAESFKVEAKRSDKGFPMSSIELSQYVGGLLSDEYPDIKVDVHSPELVVHIEVREAAAYFDAPIVTEILPADRFWPAEDYHQGYFLQNPGTGYCQAVVGPKFFKARERYARLWKD